MLSTVHGVHGLLMLLLVIGGVLCLLGGAWRCWVRDFPAGVVLIVVGIILLAVS